MGKKEELQARIAKGESNIMRLCKAADRISPGDKRAELVFKTVRMLMSLGDLKDGFIELYPGDCLYEAGKECSSHNKGTFCCASCPSYLNAVYDMIDNKQEQMAL